MPQPLEPSPWRFAVPPNADDFVALGGDLEPSTLMAAYCAGLFPMPEGGEIGWWSPVERGVLRLGDLRVSASLKKSTRRFELRINTAFREVVEHCADPDRPHGWISPEIVEAYCRLHGLGWAHSVETWRDGELVGGLYGIAVGGLFAGESMFSLERDASKVALVGLVSLLSDELASERLIDTQWVTPHLASLGVSAMARADYLALLPELLTVPLPSSIE